MNYFNYFSEIEETFNRRRGKYQFLSPIDWALMEDWEKRGVPLHVVLRGIEKVFDNQDAKAGRRRSVKGLSYCREEVEAQYEEWLERQVGKNNSETETAIDENSGFSADSLKNHLSQVSGELRVSIEKTGGSLKETLERVTARLAELEKDYADAESLENALSDLEKVIDAALLETKNEEAVAEITKNLASYKNKMEKDAYERTFELMLLKELRTRAEIPRLSLFYL